MFCLSQTTEEQIVRKQHHGPDSSSLQESEEVLYKIDIPANRYDMLCLEGIARALNIFLRQCPVVKYTVASLTGDTLDSPRPCGAPTCIGPTNGMLLLVMVTLLMFMWATYQGALLCVKNMCAGCECMHVRHVILRL